MAATDPNPEPIVQSLERYRLRLGFWQAIWGTLISGGVAVAIPAAVEAYKARLDLRKAEQEVALKQKEIEGKAQDLHQTYISKFIDTALNQDIELRLRFSEYFSYVSDKESRDQWKLYHENLEKRRDAIRLSINDKEMRAAHLGALSKPSEVEQIEVFKLKRELEWHYGEVGYARQDSNITVPSTSALATRLDPKAMQTENEQLFDQVIVDPRRVPDLDRIAERIKTNKERYQAIETKTGVPWFVLGLLHNECCSGDFSRHLNGDSLSARTVTVPRGRPLLGDPPFSWEDSAVDIVSLYRWQNADWSGVGAILYRLESFDGFGYRTHNVRSPSVWGCTNLYISGKFVSDGVFDPNAKSIQCGTGALLKVLVERKIVELAK
jgi:lysozyme family protein